MRSTLLRDDAAVLGRLSRSRDPGMRIGGTAAGSMPKEDESEDMRDREGMSGDCGGAKPVMQSMTRKRGSLLEREDWDALLVWVCGAGLLSKSSRLLECWLIRSTRWIAV